MSPNCLRKTWQYFLPCLFVSLTTMIAIADEPSAAAEATPERAAATVTADDPFVGDYVGTFHPLGEYGGKPSPEDGEDFKPRQCGNCHTEARVERSDSGYRLTLLVDHGKDKEGKPVTERIALKGQRQDKGLFFSDDNYSITLAGGEASGGRTGRMAAEVKLTRKAKSEADKTTALNPTTDKVDLQRLPSPILIQGDDRTAYRDPAAIYHAGTFYLYMTLSTIDPDGLIYNQTAWSKSRDLLHWTDPKPFTPKDRAKNYSSPGNIIRDGEDFVLCLQTYPTPQKPTPAREPGAPRWVMQYGDHTARLWTMRSRDLEHWGEPELLRVKGPDVPQEAMGRLIDPYLVRDKDDPSRWWCFYKEQGKVCYAWSRDLKSWTPAGVGAGGENPCVIIDGDEYVLFYAPHSGVGVKRSQDMKTWRDCGTLTLGLKDWDWAKGRLSAGFVLDLRREPRVGKAIMFFHGSRWPEGDPRGGWANHVSLGIAWSDDLVNWSWPGKGNGGQ